MARREDASQTDAHDYDGAARRARPGRRDARRGSRVPYRGELRQEAGQGVSSTMSDRTERSGYRASRSLPVPQPIPSPARNISTILVAMGESAWLAMPWLTTDPILADARPAIHELWVTRSPTPLAVHLTKPDAVR